MKDLHRDPPALRAQLQAGERVASRLSVGGIGRVPQRRDQPWFVVFPAFGNRRRIERLRDGKRRRRIAAGSGTKVEDVNKLLKMHRQMADMMKAMGKNKGLMAKMFGGMGGGLGAMMGGGMPQPTPEQMAELQKGQIPQGLALPKGPMPKGLPGLGGGALPGLGGLRLPGLPGGPPQGGKKK